jgi:hypothetical protein
LKLIEQHQFQFFDVLFHLGIEATRQLLKATTEDQSVIKTKAQYILHHFLEKYKELSNELWKPKGTPPHTTSL